MTKTFVQYIRAIVRGPLLSVTVHDGVVEGCVGLNHSGRAELWERLKTEMGEQEAERAVRGWIKRPYPLPRGE